MPTPRRHRPIGVPAASAHQCRVYAFSCDADEDREAIAFLQGVAVGQTAHFVKIFPWQTLCQPHTKFYVSLAFPAPYTERHPRLTFRTLLQLPTPPQICGWLATAYEPRRRAVYVNALATRTPTDRTYGGVGQQLLAALESDVFHLSPAPAPAPAPLADYIYLYPLDDAAHAFYTKAGYVQLDPTPENPNLFRIRPGARGPSPAFLKSLRRPVMTDADVANELLADLRARLTPAERRTLAARLNADPSAEFVVKELYYGDRDDAASSSLASDSSMSVDSASSASASASSASSDGLRNVREWLSAK